VTKTRAFVLRCLSEGQAAGEFRDDVPASALAIVVMGTIQMLALSTAKRLPLATPAKDIREGLGVLLRPATKPVLAPRAKRAARG